MPSNSPPNHFTPLIPDFPFFHEETQDIYKLERDLFRSMSRELTTQKGVQCQYYVTTLDTDSNRGMVTTEDLDRKIERKFTVQTYFALPQEDFYTFAPVGMEFINDFRIQIEFEHFAAVSQYNSTMTSAVYESIVPKAGDLIFSQFNKTFYEIVSVKQNDGQFLKYQSIWSLYVREMKDEKMDTSGNIEPGDIINRFNNVPDIFNISAAVEEIFREDVAFDPPEDDPAPPPNSNFMGGW